MPPSILAAARKVGPFAVIWRMISVLGFSLLAPAIATADASEGVAMGVDLLYRSADQIALGLSASFPGQRYGEDGIAPCVRLGIATRGASVSLGATTFTTQDMWASATLHATVLQTFSASSWDSGTWVGPEASLHFVMFKFTVGQFWPIGDDRSSRTQLGAGLGFGF